MSKQTKSYQSYLLRCWVSPAKKPGGSPQQRFIVETVSNEPRRWAFDTVEGFVTFMREELEESEVELDMVDL